MSKIVIDARESGTTTGRYVDKLIEYLSRAQPSHDFIVLAKAHRLDFLRQLAPSFEVIETQFKEFTFGEQLGFKRQIDSLGADLVHFPMVQQPVRYRGKVVTTMNDLTTIRFKNPSKNPVVFTLKQQVYKWVNKRVARQSAALLTYSNFVKQDIIDYTHVSPDKISVVNLAADSITDPPEAVTELVGQQFILYLGRPLPHKNLPRLIAAFESLQRTHPTLKLVLAGKQDSVYQQIIEQVRLRGVSNVVFTGFISDAQLRWLYEECIAYVFPSLSEGFGLPGLEAMVHGAPVVSSNATCLPEIYGDAAHYFNPLDVADMAAKIGTVLNDPTLRNNLIQSGYRQAAKYSWQRMTEQTLVVYEAALKKS